jgi:hypothetical protein
VEIEPHHTAYVMLKPLFELESKSEPSSYSHAPSILAINGAFTGIALVVVVLRVYVRTTILKFVGADDYVIVAAMVRNRPPPTHTSGFFVDSAFQICGVGVLACFIGECKAGVGRHIQYISPPELQTIYHWIYFHSLINMVGVSLVKISVALFLLRLVPGRWYNSFVIGIIGTCLPQWVLSKIVEG